MARVADQLEWYEDMLDFLKEFVQESSGDISSDVRNLLSVGLKNFIYSHRSSWKTVQREKAYAFLLSASFKSKKGRHIWGKSYESGIGEGVGTETGPGIGDEAKAGWISGTIILINNLIFIVLFKSSI